MVILIDKDNGGSHVFMSFDFEKMLGLGSRGSNGCNAIFQQLFCWIEGVIKTKEEAK
ncbi:MAG: hypothetical protein V7785_15995 [Bermanella sp.]